MILKKVISSTLNLESLVEAIDCNSDMDISIGKRSSISLSSSNNSLYECTSPTTGKRKSEDDFELEKKPQRLKFSAVNLLDLANGKQIN